MAQDTERWNVDRLNQRTSVTIGSSIPMTFVEASRERVVVTMRVGPHIHQPAGILHGGASLVLAETAASVGANILCAEGMRAVGQEINANHLRAKRDGVLRAVAVPAHVGRTTQVWTIEIRDEEEKLVCISRCTLAVLPSPAGAPPLL